METRVVRPRMKGFGAQLRRRFGFDVDGVDYDEPVQPDVPFPR